MQRARGLWTRRLPSDELVQATFFPRIGHRWCHQANFLSSTSRRTPTSLLKSVSLPCPLPSKRCQGEKSCSTRVDRTAAGRASAPGWEHLVVYRTGRSLPRLGKALAPREPIRPRGTLPCRPASRWSSGWCCRSAHPRPPRVETPGDDPGTGRHRSDPLGIPILNGSNARKRNTSRASGDLTANASGRNAGTGEYPHPIKELRRSRRAGQAATCYIPPNTRYGARAKLSTSRTTPLFALHNERQAPVRTRLCRKEPSRTTKVHTLPHHFLR